MLCTMRRGSYAWSIALIVYARSAIPSQLCRLRKEPPNDSRIEEIHVGHLRRRLGSLGTLLGDGVQQDVAHWFHGDEASALEDCAAHATAGAHIDHHLA